MSAAAAATATAKNPMPACRPPPPTPIATGKGLRSAAVDDKVLADFLGTLRVPDLTLPEKAVLSPAPSSFHSPSGIDLQSLISGNEEYVMRMVASAAVAGAFRIDGAVSPEDVRTVLEIGGEVFRIPEARKRELRGCFGRSEGVGKEVFYWDWRRRSAEIETALEEVLPSFREKMENLSTKMEMVAQCIQRNLTKHVKNQQSAYGSRWMRPVLCLGKCDNHPSDGNWNKCEAAEFHNFYDLILHLCINDDKFSIQPSEGSSSLCMPTGSILVTVGEQVQEWCSSGFKSASEEISSELSHVPKPSGSIEFTCSSTQKYHEDQDDIKTVTIMDQIMIMLVLTLLCRLWS